MIFFATANFLVFLAFPMVKNFIQGISVWYFRSSKLALSHGRPQNCLDGKGRIGTSSHDHIGRVVTAKSLRHENKIPNSFSRRQKASRSPTVSIIVEGKFDRHDLDSTAGTTEIPACLPRSRRRVPFPKNEKGGSAP